MQDKITANENQWACKLKAMIEFNGFKYERILHRRAET